MKTSGNFFFFVMYLFLASGKVSKILSMIRLCVLFSFTKSHILCIQALRGNVRTCSAHSRIT